MANRPLFQMSLEKQLRARWGWNLGLDFPADDYADNTVKVYLDCSMTTDSELWFCVEVGFTDHGIPSVKVTPLDSKPELEGVEL